MIKLRVFLFVLLATVRVYGGSVSLAWDASPSPGITNYVLYAGTNNPATNATHLIKVNAGTNLTVRVEGLTPPTTWFFWATAQAGGLESDRSNVVQAQVPFPPANSRVLVVQAGVNLTNGFTDVGWFRLYFPANVP